MAGTPTTRRTESALADTPSRPTSAETRSAIEDKGEREDLREWGLSSTAGGPHSTTQSVVSMEGCQGCHRRTWSSNQSHHLTKGVLNGT